MANPFVFGKPVAEQDFCDREQETTRLLALFASRNSGWLYSPRRYGKTSLIRHALAQVPELHHAYVDLWPTGTEQDAVSALLRGYTPLIASMSGGLEKALRTASALLQSIRPVLSVDDGGTPTLTVAPASTPRERTLDEVLALPQALAERYDTRVLIALDEFQEVSSVRGLEARMRSAFQHQDRVSYLMAGSQASLLETMFTSPERPFFQFGEHIPVSRIPEEELVRFVLRRFGHAGREVEESTARALVRLAQHHPHYVQYFAYVAYNHLHQGVPEGEELEARVTDEIASTMDVGFRMVFDALAASQQGLLVSVARRGGERLLSEARRRLDELGPASTVASARQALEGKGLLVREGDRWVFPNPALRLWILERVAPAKG